MENGHAGDEPQLPSKEFGSAQARIEKDDLRSRAQSGVLEAINKRKEVDFRASHGLLIAFIFLLLVLKVIGIYLFTSGFLLTRLVLEDKSDCAAPPADIGEGHVAGSFDRGCWHPKTFDKAVVIIIDALRYDFTVPFQSTPDQPAPRAFHDRIPVFYDTAISHPENAVLLPFIADPPTTTLQRLKGLTTGTLPTFVDAGSNFAGTAIDEDNLVMQAVKANKTVVHLGDDTWHSLFPGYFDEELTRPFDSFNVWDLHTVDNGVSHHLLPLLHPSNTSRWDVLFGHYLGVDHAGHRYGPDHPAMKAKLIQMDALVRQAMELIDESTVLIVMGDHGMDSKGDHGGESDDEVEAALWMYSRAKAFGRSSQDSLKPPPTAKERPVNQIDLVPTLAYLLGLPVPFNNLGTPIEEAFIGAGGNNYANLASVNRLTAAQIRNYQREYAQIRKPDAAAMAIPDRHWHEATKLWRDQKSSSWAKTSPKQFQMLAEAFHKYQATNLQVCKDLWARFDIVSMAMGVFVLAVTFALTLTFARGIEGDITALSTVLFVRGFGGLVIGTALGATVGYLSPVAGLIRSAAFAGSVSCCLALLIQLQMFRDRLKSVFPRSMWSWACIASVILLSAGFGSNSYTIWEDEIDLFFLGFFAILMLSAIFRLPGSVDRKAGYYHVAAFMLSIRLASLSRLCRDEQMPYCRSTYYASSTSSTSAPWQLIISWLVALVLPSTIKAYFWRTQSYQGSAPFWIGVAFRICLFLTAVFWTLEVADDGEWLPNAPVGILKTVRVYVAQFVLAAAVGAGGATFAYQAPYIGIETLPPPDQQPQGQRSKNADVAVAATDAKPQLVVHGTSNLYGSHYAVLPLTVVLIPLLLVSKPMGQAALSFTVVALLSLLELTALLRRIPHAVRASSTSGAPSGATTKTSLKSAAPSSSQAETVTTVLAPTILAFLAHFTFFKTGHQAVMASMQWDAAFIALHTVRYPWSVLLVVLNTAAGQILCAAAVPAVVLWRRPHRFFSGSSDAEGEATLKPGGAGTDARERNASRAAARREILSACARAALTHSAVYAALNLATTVFAGHLRRHLMLYRVFSPRWMVGIVGVAIADIVLCAVSLVGAGRSIGAVSGVFGW